MEYWDKMGQHKRQQHATKPYLLGAFEKFQHLQQTTTEYSLLALCIQGRRFERKREHNENFNQH